MEERADGYTGEVDYAAAETLGQVRSVDGCEGDAEEIEREEGDGFDGKVRGGASGVEVEVGDDLR